MLKEKGKQFVEESKALPAESKALPANPKVRIVNFESVDKRKSTSIMLCLISDDSPWSAKIMVCSLKTSTNALEASSSGQMI